MPLPGGRLNLLASGHEPRRGRRARSRLGFIRAEAEIHPDDWFLVCHFVDDRVMPGTLMYESCLQALRILLMRMGWIGRRGQVVFEPIPGVAIRLKCRGQVVESTSLVTYEVTVKERGYRPEPYAIADALVMVDGKADRRAHRHLAATDRNETGNELETLWSGSAAEASCRASATDSGGLLRPRSDSRICAGQAGASVRRALPAVRGWPPLSGAVAGTSLPVRRSDHAHRRARRGSWRRAHRPWPSTTSIPTPGSSRPIERDSLPLAILLEVALQPCGWLAAYMGSALNSEEDLVFRNLGGSARQHRRVSRESGTLTTRVKATKITSAAGMILQSYEFAVRLGRGTGLRRNGRLRLFPSPGDGRSRWASATRRCTA